MNVAGVSRCEIGGDRMHDELSAEEGSHEGDAKNVALAATLRLSFVVAHKQAFASWESLKCLSDKELS